MALSGVFDIAAHFSHERSRLVHWISPMWLAMIGRRRAASNAHDEVGHGEVGALNEPTPRKASDDESDGGFADDSGAEFAVRVVRAMGLRAKTEECAAAAAAAAADPAGTTPATLSSAGIDSATLAAASQLPSQGRDAVWSDVAGCGRGQPHARAFWALRRQLARAATARTRSGCGRRRRYFTVRMTRRSGAERS